MTRLAFFSPLPPAPTGIADYSADVLALLGPHYAIDAFHDQALVERDRLPAACEVAHVSDFAARSAERPYDLAVYQMGNGPEHAFLYDHLAAVPGLLVLHDLVLHHSRARRFLDSPEARAYAADPSSSALREPAEARLAQYRAEADYCYPRQAGRLADTHLGTVGALLPYAYPLFRLPAESARAVAVHNGYMAAAVREEVPEADVHLVAMPIRAVSVSPVALRGARERLGLGSDLVVGSFGLLTPEKGLETVARAVARAAAWLPSVRLLLVGPVPDPPALEAQLARLGVRERTIVTGRVPFAELPVLMEVADIVVHLRYPTARETSAALLRVLAQGRPTILSDLAHLDDIPAAAVIRARTTDEEGDVTRNILRLAERPRERERLGEAARAFLESAHHPSRALDTYRAAIEAARRRPSPPVRPWPAHWPRPTAHP